MSRAERDASSARWASIKLDRDKFDFAKLQDSIESGREPYHITLDGTRYYRAGDAYWTVDKEGKRSEIRYSKKMYDESGNSIGGNSIGGDSGNKGKLKSAYKDFKMGDKKFVKGSGFNPEKASKWDVAQLNNYQRGELNKYHKEEEEGATLDDVDIYVDGDYVRVVPKNTNEYGLVSSMTGDTKMGGVK